MALLAVHTTVATPDQARAIARALVEERLAACVQFESIESIYRWRGAVHAEPEVRLTCKTTAARYPALAGRLRLLHPYEQPTIDAVVIAYVEADHEAWVDECVAEPDEE